MMPPKIHISLLLIFLMSSCVKDVDFNQSNDISFQPKYVASLIYFDVNQMRFIDDFGAEINYISDSTTLPFGSSSIINDYLTKAEFQFKITNSFDRAMVFNLVFKDDFGTTVFTFTPITIQANTTKTFFQTVEANALTGFKKGKTAKMELLILPGTPIIPSIPKNLNVQISGTFYFDIHN